MGVCPPVWPRGCGCAGVVRLSQPAWSSASFVGVFLRSSHPDLLYFSRYFSRFLTLCDGLRCAIVPKTGPELPAIPSAPSLL